MNQKRVVILSFLVCKLPLKLGRRKLKLPCQSQFQLPFPRCPRPWLVVFLVRHLYLLSLHYFPIYLDIHKLTMIEPLETYESRLLILTPSDTIASQYLNFMNSVFSAQKNVRLTVNVEYSLITFSWQKVTIDGLYLGRLKDSALLQQAAFLTGGLYLKAETSRELALKLIVNNFYSIPLFFKIPS